MPTPSRLNTRAELVAAILDRSLPGVLVLPFMDSCDVLALTADGDVHAAHNESGEHAARQPLADLPLDILATFERRGAFGDAARDLLADFDVNADALSAAPPHHTRESR